MSGFCTECGGGLINGACPGGHLQPRQAVISSSQAIAGVSAALTIGTLPKAPIMARLFGAGIEFTAFVVLQVLGVVTGGIAGLATGPMVVAFLFLRDVNGGMLSVGKRVGGLRVVDLKTGRPASTRQGVLRNSYYLALAVLVVLPGVNVATSGLFTTLGLLDFLMVLASPQGRRLGDQIAGTQVVVERR